jgi:hypothetical protein
VNAFSSRGDAEKVKLGMARKHAEGGTMGRAPIGYLNTREKIEGREIRVIHADPERGRWSSSRLMRSPPATTP